MGLPELGWDGNFAARFQERAQPGWQPARILREECESYLLGTADGELTARVSGRFRHEALGRADWPAVGDWVACEVVGGAAIVRAVLPRRSRFVRLAPASTREDRSLEQIVAANVDVVFVVGALDGERNLNRRRLERYLTLAWDSGARPVLVLNKADLCDDVEAILAELAGIALGVPVHAVSAASGDVAALEDSLSARQTGVFLGSSGVGKSSLINALLGEQRLDTSGVRDDLKGRHTTTHRELLRLPNGALIIDTPGMRELRLTGAEEGHGATFEDVEALAAACRFRDCAHGDEPGCAIQQALADGTLEPGRYRSYQKLLREQAHAARAQTNLVRSAERRQGKARAKFVRALRRDPRGKY